MCGANVIILSLRRIYVACALSPDSDLTSFEDPGADKLPSSRIFEMETLLPEFNIEAEVDSRAASDALVCWRATWSLETQKPCYFVCTKEITFINNEFR